MPLLLLAGSGLWAGWQVRDRLGGLFGDDKPAGAGSIYPADLTFDYKRFLLYAGLGLGGYLLLKKVL